MAALPTSEHTEYTRFHLFMIVQHTNARCSLLVVNVNLLFSDLHITPRALLQRLQSNYQIIDYLISYKIHVCVVLLAFRK